MYGGPENWAAGLPSEPAMLGCGGGGLVRKGELSQGRVVVAVFGVERENYMGVIMDFRVFALLPAGRKFRSCG
jgi:hypothetical protein